MIYWAMEFKTARTWSIDYRTIRTTRQSARQAPLDNNPTDEYWNFYDQRLRAGTARAVKVRIVRSA